MFVFHFWFMLGYVHIIANRYIVQKNFVQVVRAVEVVLGITVPGLPPQSFHTSNFTAALVQASKLSIFSQEVRSVLLDTAPILQGVAIQLSLDLLHFSPSKGLAPLTTKCVLYLSTQSSHQTNCTASWTLTGSITTPPTLPMQRLVLRYMTTTSITRE